MSDQQQNQESMGKWPAHTEAHPCTGMHARATGWPLFLAFLASGSRIFGSSRERKGRVTSKKEKREENEKEQERREGEKERGGKTSPAPKTGRRDLWSGWEFLLPLTLLCYATPSLHPYAAVGCFLSFFFFLSLSSLFSLQSTTINWQWLSVTRSFTSLLPFGLQIQLLPLLLLLLYGCCYCCCCCCSHNQQ